MKVACEGVVVVADGRLARAAESPTVVGDDAGARAGHRPGLLLPGVLVERVPVDQDDRLTRSVILEEEIDILSVLLTHRDLRHGGNVAFWSSRHIAHSCHFYL